jgi:hypothetical protein
VFSLASVIAGFKKEKDGSRIVKGGNQQSSDTNSGSLFQTPTVP